MLNAKFSPIVTIFVISQWIHGFSVNILTGIVLKIRNDSKRKCKNNDKWRVSPKISLSISDYLPLKKKGANFWALSPFANEKTPSFAVNPVKGIYKDFSSGRGGNAVNFLMELEGFTYVEALRHLAQKYGIEIAEEEDSPEQRQAKDKRQSLFIVNEFAARWFQEQL